MVNNEMDEECRGLCGVINRNLPGLQTIESCCGHRERKYHIWIHAKTIESLAPLAYYLMRCHGGSGDWNLIVRTDCGMSRPSFLLEGPIGEKAYEEAKQLTKKISGYNESEEKGEEDD